MNFAQKLQPVILVRRYQRFLADVELADHSIITVHCPNSGSMLGCQTPGLAAMISRSANPNRKYPHTLEMVRVNQTWIGINTSLTNRLVKEAIEHGIIQELLPFDTIRAEVKTGQSRLDFLLQNGESKIWLEVKNCTMAQEKTAMFPDAVTARGTKHLHELLKLKKEGHRAAILFCVQREDTDCFTPARQIDPLYAEILGQVYKQGVEILAYQAQVSPEQIMIVRKLPIVI
ncbi:MAG: DNA/RNA nuclease SfsA [Proteobacteria bacterium]|nr:DNA/RNA nuclease SfsA [Pseudomonadota bacterium]MBU1717110.1 DNA/RNA nuclease SfsA [Pseudomonadota bacterium]